MPFQSNNLLAGGEAMVDAVRTISSLYMTSAQRLLELNLNTMRESVEKTAEATRSTSGARSPQELQGVFQPMLDCAQEYSRDAFEIIVGTQQEVMKVMLTQFAGPNSMFSLPTDWSAAFDAFNTGVRRFSTMATENATEAVEAGQRAFTSATQGKRSA
ncbi:MAG: phasin family protein [Aromatoleum sp.]|jgi:phasin family protein|uniref:phasin family protein n=1 Tax=Aromatoleum sp. TaxID=2307007 RepID=UPI00289596B2|nr:phasin family protein [Aromatoleum sp.]MDT3672454.1 phasin family protein [Aromatoleum sp.]